MVCEEKDFLNCWFLLFLFIEKITERTLCKVKSICVALCNQDLMWEGDDNRFHWNDWWNNLKRSDNELNDNWNIERITKKIEMTTIKLETVKAKG